MTIKSKYHAEYISNLIATGREVRDSADGGTPEEIRHIVKNLHPTTEYDFTADLDGKEYRFIANCCINGVIKDDLKSDPYTLGGFNAWFLAKYVPLNEDQIKHVQDADGFEAIGYLVLAHGQIDELIDHMISLDGYGHYFNHYDGEEIELDNAPYRMFRVN